MRLSTDNTSPRQYFVLTEAGKPVFVSEDAPIGKDEDALSSTMSLVQALMSIFIDEGDKLRCINAGRMRITFLQRSPLYLVCVSNWGEPESVVSPCQLAIFFQIRWLSSALAQEDAPASGIPPFTDS